MQLTENPNDTFSPTRCTWVMDDTDLAFLLDAIETCEEVVMDLETTGLFEHSVTNGKVNGGVAARISMASLTLPQEGEAEPTSYIVPLSHPDSPWLGTWVRVMRQIAMACKNKPLVNANVKYDCKWIAARCGVDLSHMISWDTQISSHLLDETRSTKLKERVPLIFGIDRWDDHDLTYPGASEDVPMFELGLYAARDTYWTWKLAVHHRTMMFLMGNEDEGPESREEVEDARLGLLATWVAMPTTATLTAIEERGMGLDVQWVTEQIAEHVNEAARLKAKLIGMYPENEELPPEDASFAPTSLWFMRWAETAIEAGHLKVTALTPTGKPQWSKGVLKRQARKGSQLASDLLDYRGHTKKLEFLNSWMDYLAPDERIYTNYNAGSVLTGRLSSSSPNMQQVTKTLRPAFVPTPGYYIADLDYSQIELRVAAFISRSKPMIGAYRRGEDLHKLMAQAITGKSLGQITKEDRQSGKSANFGLLYGMGAYGFMMYAEDAYDVVFSEEEATKVHRAFFTLWDGIAAWHTEAIRKAHRDGQISSPVGRVRRLPGIFSDNEKMVSFSERAAINSPVQGFASDLMQIAAAVIEGTMPGYDAVPGARIVGTVHDDILVEVPINNWEEVTRQCKDRMENAVLDVLRKLGVDFDVPLQADAEVGTRWGVCDVGEI